MRMGDGNNATGHLVLTGRMVERRGQNKGVKAQQAFHEKTQPECKLHRISCLAIIIHTLNARKPGKDPVSEPTHTNSRLGAGGPAANTTTKRQREEFGRRPAEN